MSRNVAEVVTVSIMLTLILSGCGKIFEDVPESETVVWDTSSIDMDTTEADENRNKKDEPIPKSVTDLYNRFVASKDAYGGVDLQKEAVRDGVAYKWNLYTTEEGEQNAVTLYVTPSESGEITEFTVPLNNSASTDSLKQIIAWTIMSVDTSCDKAAADEFATRILDDEIVKTKTYTFFIDTVDYPTGIYPPIWLEVKNNDFLSDTKIEQIRLLQFEIKDYSKLLFAYYDIMDELAGEEQYTLTGAGNYVMAGDYMSGQIDADITTDYGDVVIHLVYHDRNWSVESITGADDGLCYYNTQEGIPIYDLKTKEEKPGK